MAMTRFDPREKFADRLWTREQVATMVEPLPEWLSGPCRLSLNGSWLMICDDFKKACWNEPLPEFGNYDGLIRAFNAMPIEPGCESPFGRPENVNHKRQGYDDRQWTDQERRDAQWPANMIAEMRGEGVAPYEPASIPDIQLNLEALKATTHEVAGVTPQMLAKLKMRCEPEKADKLVWPFPPYEPKQAGEDWEIWSKRRNGFIRVGRDAPRKEGANPVHAPPDDLKYWPKCAKCDKPADFYEMESQDMGALYKIRVHHHGKVHVIEKGAMEIACLRGPLEAFTDGWDK